MSHFTDFTGYVLFIITSFLAGVESTDQCLLNSKVLSCFSGVIMSIRSFFLYALNLIYDTTRLSILCSKVKECICIGTLLMVPQAGTETGWYLKGCPNLGPLSMVQSVVINFSSNLYSKSLPKGSVVYSLILDYQFCACVMRISSFPQLQVIHMKPLYSYK